MKMKPEHFEELKVLMKETIEIFSREELEKYKESLKHDPRVKILEERFRWDIFNACDQQKRSSFVKKVYQYCHDDHIDTALKKIVTKIHNL